MAASTIADEPTRRDFLFVATGAMGVAAAGFVAWPLIDQMSPDATTLAASSTEVDIANIAEGQIVTVKWRGKPIFISHRTPKEIEDARAVPLSELRDPASDESRVQSRNGSSLSAFARISAACRSRMTALRGRLFLPLSRFGL